MTSWSKERLLQFIDMYRSNECLWKIKSKEYNNKNLKEKSYEKLIRSVRGFDPEVNKDSVVKKINNLRSFFRKEVKKVETSKLLGLEPDEFYVPKLWYYNNLMFLKDQDVPQPARSSVDGNESIEIQSIAINQITDVLGDTCSQEHFSAVSSMDQAESFHSTSTISRPCSAPVDYVPHPARESNANKKRKTPDDEDELLVVACERLKNTPTTDKFDTFGQTVAHNLREMSLEQYLHAQKLISEVLYEGSLRNLSRSSYLVTAAQGCSVAYTNQHTLEHEERFRVKSENEGD